MQNQSFHLPVPKCLSRAMFTRLTKWVNITFIVIGWKTLDPGIAHNELNTMKVMFPAMPGLGDDEHAARSSETMPEANTD